MERVRSDDGRAQVGDSMAIVDIKGEVTAACEPVLMSAYEEPSGEAAQAAGAQFRRP